MSILPMCPALECYDVIWKISQIQNQNLFKNLYNAVKITPTLYDQTVISIKRNSYICKTQSIQNKYTHSSWQLCNCFMQSPLFPSLFDGDFDALIRFSSLSYLSSKSRVGIDSIV